MKKALLMAVLAVFAMGMIQGATITVTQPSGGEVTMTCPVQIAWTASGVTSNIKILLRKPGGALVTTIANNLPVSPGLYSWTVAAPAVVGESYKIHVRATDGSAEGASAVFTVKDPGAPPPPPPPPPPSSSTVTIVSPNGGESWVRGSEQTISWTSTNLTGKVYLQLARYNDRTLGTIKDNLPAAGSISWKAGEYPGNTAPVGQYVIRVRSMADYKIFDESDAPFSLTLMINQFKQPIALKVKEYKTLPGIYQNYPGYTSFPKANYLPSNAYLGVWNQIVPAICNPGGPNHTALVAVYWYPYNTIQVAVIYRSRIRFPLSQFAGKSAELESAKLKMKRLHSQHDDANSGCGCNENLWVLMAPMTSFAYPAIGQRIDVDLGATEFSKDITDIVKKWLDGTLANNGLLLLAGELPCSGGRLCCSCYEASLVLTMK
ncbi:MAG: hypothetical protein ABII93_05270 [Chrysiogenia bacterium]